MSETKKPKPSNNRLNFLLSPWSVLVGAVIGITIALEAKQVVPFIAPLGQAYLSILKMCVLPILLTAIASSLGRLMRSEVGGRYLWRITLVCIPAMLITSLVGVSTGVFGKPGEDLGKETLATLGSIVQKSAIKPDLEISLSDSTISSESDSSLGSFFLDMIPENIFSALSFGDNLQVLFFSILFGMTLGFIKDHLAEFVFTLLDALNQAFSVLIRWLMYALPFGLCGLIANQFSKVGIEILLAMTRFVVVSLIAFGIMYILSLWVLVWRYNSSVGRLLHMLHPPAMIAFVTGNSLAAIPSTITAMGEGLKFEKRMVDLLVPLSVTICRFGPILYFAVAGLFIAQLYNTEVNLNVLIILIVGSILAGMATAGAAGIATLAMMALLLEPLGLPLDAVIVLFVVVDPITAPFRSLTNILVACAVTSLIAQSDCDSNQYTEENDRRVGRRSIQKAV